MDPRMLIGNNGITDLNKPSVKGNIKHLNMVSNICSQKKTFYDPIEQLIRIEGFNTKMHSWVINQSQ